MVTLAVHRGFKLIVGLQYSALLSSIVRSSTVRATHILTPFAVMMLLRTWAIWRRTRNILIYLGVILVVRVFYPNVVLTLDPCIQLCTIVAFGCTLYEMLTVISERHTLSRKCAHALDRNPFPRSASTLRDHLSES